MRNILPTNSKLGRTVLLAVLVCGGGWSVRGEIELPPCFSDNMVLQRTTPDTQPEEVVLWGWMGRKEAVKVSWPGVKDGIPARRGDQEPDGRRRWSILKEDLDRHQARLEPRGSFDLVLSRWQRGLFKEWGKRLDDLRLTNVWVGDVWIVGQLEGQFQRARLGNQRPVFASAAEQVRQADLRGDRRQSQPCDWRPCDLDFFSAKWPVLCYAITNAAARRDPSPRAFVLAPNWYQYGLPLCNAIETNAPQANALPNPARLENDVPTRATLLGCQQAWTLLSNERNADWQDFQTAIEKAKIQNQPIPTNAPLACSPAPKRVHLGTPTNVCFRVRGVLW